MRYLGMINRGRHLESTPHRPVALFFSLTLLLCFRAPLALAQTSDETEAESPVAAAPGSDQALADRQAVVSDRVKRLEDRMFQLAQILEKTEPDKAKRMLESLGALRDKNIRGDVNDVVALLRDGSLTDAADRQVTVEQHMRELLRLLLDENGDLEEQKAEIERLEQLKQALNKLVEEQRRQKQRAEARVRQQQLTESLQAAADQVRDLLGRQQALQDQKENALSGERADRQAALRGETESVADQLDEIADALNQLAEAEAKLAAEAEAAARDAEAEQQGAAEAGEGAEGASSDESAEPPTESEGNAAGAQAATSDDAESSDSQQSSGEGESSGDGESSAQSASEAGESLKAASEAMRAAEQSMREGGSPGETDQQQQSAEAALEEALDKLGEEIEARRNKLSLKDEAEEQRELAEKSRDVLKDMEGEGESEAESSEGQGGESSEGESSESGDSQEGQSGQQGQQNQQGGQQNQGQQQGGEQSPGQQSLEEAIPFQDEAAERFEQDQGEEGVQKQAEALEKLEQAKQDLEQQLEQMRREQQEQMLAALESRMRAMLSRQVEVNKATRRLSELGVDNWDRKDQNQLGEVVEKQRWVSTQADEALFILKEEGSTVVLPPLIEQVRDDASYVADQLAVTDVGRPILLAQEDLELVLRDIIDAVVRQQEELQQGGESGGGGGGNSPLLPGSAELKLLRACQVRINNTTEKLAVEVELNNGDAKPIEPALQRLADKQKDVSEMARNMHESLRRAQ